MQSRPLHLTKRRRPQPAVASTISRPQSNDQSQPKLVLVDGPSRPMPAAARMPDSIPAQFLEGFVEEWLGDAEYRECTHRTLDTYRTMVGNLVWFVRERGYDQVGLPELRAFFLYVRNGHQDPRGRWGLGYCRHEPSSTRCTVEDPKLRCVILGSCRKPVSSGTVKDYYIRVQVFYRWMVKRRYIADNPFSVLDAPIHRPDQLQPFSEEQVEALITAARRSQNPDRDETIVLLLFDTGIRNDELCGLKRRDLDMGAAHKSIRVEGKGRKKRSIYLGKSTVRQLWKYLRNYSMADDDPLFQNSTGAKKGQSLCKDGLDSIFERLGDEARIEGIRCSPHTMRHTSAIEFLRAGGTLAELMERLGHTNMSMTRKYVAFAEADIVRQSRFSPADARSRKHG